MRAREYLETLDSRELRFEIAERTHFAWLGDGHALPALHKQAKQYIIYIQAIAPPFDLPSTAGSGGT